MVTSWQVRFAYSDKSMQLLFLSFLLGLSLLLPWNSLLKSIPYVVSRVPLEWSTSAPAWLTLTFTLTNCTLLVVLTLTDADSRLIRRFTGWREVEKVVGGRLYGGLVGCSLMLAVACAAPIADYWSGPGRSLAHLFLFWAVFVLTGAFMCLLQRSVYPLMSLIPGRKDLMISSMLTGQAVAGIAASLGSFLFTSGIGGVMALVYFGASILALVATIFCFKGYQTDREATTSTDKQAASTQNENANANDKQAAVFIQNEDKKFSVSVLMETAKLIRPWPHLLAYNFAMTLGLFPSLLTSAGSPLTVGKYFVPLTFLVFDIFDLAGKVSPSIPGIGRGRLGPKSVSAIIFPLARTLFIPAFLLLPNYSVFKGVVGGGGGWLAPTDVWYFMLLAAFAWTSGWGNAICLINGPLSAQDRAVHFSDEIGDRIGSLMGLSITFGLLCGAVLSIILKKLIIE